MSSSAAGASLRNGLPGSSGRPALLRDLTDRQRFVSFGAWQDMRQVEAFRQHPEFSRHVSLLREVLDDFTPSTIEAVVDF